MRMRQSLAQFERPSWRRPRSRWYAASGFARRPLSARACAAWSAGARPGSLRFVLLALSLVATAVLVTIAMFETLARIAG